MARSLLEEDKVALFEDFSKQFTKVEPEFIGKVLVEMPKEIKARFKTDIQRLQEKDFGMVLEHVQKGIVPKSAAFEILSEVAQGKMVNIEQYKGISDEKLEEEIRQLVEKEKGAPINALMGIIMAKYKGRVEGRVVIEILKKYYK